MNRTPTPNLLQDFQFSQRLLSGFGVELAPFPQTLLRLFGWSQFTGHLQHRRFAPSQIPQGIWLVIYS